MTERYDAVVIGAGLGGLSAAGYLAQASKRVLVLEHHSVPGGYAHEFRRGRFRFEVSLHALDGAAPGGWAYSVLKDLGVLDRLTFHRLDPFYTACYPDHEITAHADPIRYEAELVGLFPRQADGIRHLFDRMLRVFLETRRYLAENEAGRQVPMLDVPARFPAMLEAMGQSWLEFMQGDIEDPRLHAVLSTLWEYYGLPPSQLNAAAFILPWVSYHYFGAFYPQGGSMALSRALEDCIRTAGGEIRYRQTVAGIEVKDGRVAAVETEKGLRVESELVISNASPTDTCLKMIDPALLPPEYRQRIEAAVPSLSNLVVYLGLSPDFDPSPFPHYERFLPGGYDLEAAHARILQGDFAHADLGLTLHSRVDPACAPDGAHILSVFTLAPYAHADVWGTGGNLDHYSAQPRYLQTKQEAGETLLSRVETILPGVRESIQHIEIGTPLTNIRYSRNPAGAIYGSEQSVENMYTGRLGAATPFPNLFLTGAWVFGGGMSAALLSGRDAARQALTAGDNRIPMYPAAEPATGLTQVPTETEHASAASTSAAPSGRFTPVTLVATGFGHKVELGLPGLPTVLIFHTQETAQAGPEVNQAVRAKYPLSSQVRIASVVDLHKVPRLFRKFAEDALQQSYRQAAADLPQGLSPEEYVLILPDWDGKICRSLGLKNLDKSAGIAVLDKRGQLQGISQASPLGEAALEFLAQG